MISAILLSGGFGKRMGATTPKQYLQLQGTLVILRSLESLLTFSPWHEIVIVCEKKYEDLFSSYTHLPLRFALPGKERQDSVFSGLKALSSETKWVCIHDGARPLLEKKDLENVIAAGKEHKAATLATPIKMTIKEADSNLFVKKTLDRSSLWNIQTPQVLCYKLFLEAHLKALSENIVLTDDVSLIELLKYPVKLVPGSDSNLKITTKEDLLLANLLLEERNSHV